MSSLASLRQQIGRVSGHAETAGTLNGLINQVYNEVANTADWAWTEKVDTSLTLAAAASSLTNAIADDLWIARVDLLDGTRYHELDWAPKSDVDAAQRENGQGRPRTWSLWANVFYFDHSADQAYPLLVYYIADPATLINEADQPVATETLLDPVIVWGVCRMLALRYHEGDLYQAAAAEYERALAKMQRRERRERGDAIVDSGFFGAYDEPAYWW